MTCFGLTQNRIQASYNSFSGDSLEPVIVQACQLKKELAPPDSFFHQRSLHGICSYPCCITRCRVPVAVCPVDVWCVQGLLKRGRTPMDSDPSFILPWAPLDR